MKQKFLLLAAVLVLITSSCIKDVSVYKPIDISRFDFFEEVEIPAPASGMLSVVTSKDSGDTLMISRVAAPLEKGIFEDIEISYVPAVQTRAASESLLPEEVMTVWNSKFMVMFEDTENGDNDYNDCVFWILAKMVSKNNKHKLQEATVYPIALGSSDGTIIDFGMVLPDKSERKISNVRESMFKSQKGFINTESSNAEIGKFEAKELVEKEEKVEGPIKGVRFFIEVNGKRIYAAYGGTDGIVGVNVDKSGMPCGIVLSQAKEYPQEKVNIYTVYPLFNKWIRGGLGEREKPFDMAKGEHVDWKAPTK